MLKVNLVLGILSIPLSVFFFPWGAVVAVVALLWAIAGLMGNRQYRLGVVIALIGIGVNIVMGALVIDVSPEDGSFGTTVVEESS